MKHAEITVGGYTIPLIGIGFSETIDRCDYCGKQFNIQQLLLMQEIGRNVFACEGCRQKIFPQAIHRRLA